MNEVEKKNKIQRINGMKIKRRTNKEKWLFNARCDTHIYESFSKLRTRTYMKCSYEKDKRRRIRDAHFVCVHYVYAHA